MDNSTTTDVQTSYDQVADEYVQRIFDELAHKPFDRQLLDQFAARVKQLGQHGQLGPVCDLGCGPGHVARYLSERNVQVCGIDLSPELVKRARQLNPGIEFQQGDMSSLKIEDGAWGGIVAFYSLIHIPRSEIVGVLCELKRVLRPEGILLLSFHIGENTIHLDEWWGQPVSVDFFFFRPDEMASYLKAAGFEIEEMIEREPYPEVEHQSRRAYIFAKKPKGD